MTADPEEIRASAAELEALLPLLMRRLFTLGEDRMTLDLPVAQLRVCSILRAGPRTMSSLREELSVSLSAMTQVADRLERTGLVERVMDPEDRRARLLQLSSQGAAMMQQRSAGRIASASTALQKMTACERNAVLEALRALLTAVGAAPMECAAGCEAAEGTHD